MPLHPSQIWTVYRSRSVRVYGLNAKSEIAFVIWIWTGVEVSRVWKVVSVGL